MESIPYKLLHTLVWFLFLWTWYEVSQKELFVLAYKEAMGVFVLAYKQAMGVFFWMEYLEPMAGSKTKVKSCYS